MTDQSAQSNTAAIDSLSARLIELANMPGETVEKTGVRAWAQKNVPGLAGRDIASLPFTSVAAHMLASFGKVNEAFVLSVASVRRGSLDDLSAAVIGRVREAVLRGAFDAVFAKRPDLARAQLSFMVQHLGDAAALIEEHAALHLLSELEAIAARRAGQQPLDGRPTLVKLGVWGGQFIDSAERNVLASCLAAGNVPALAEFGPVIVHVHTSGRDAERLRSLAAIRELARHAEIKIDIIPEKFFIPSHKWGLGFWNRTILAMVEYDSLMYARQIGADMVCLGADMVLSDGYLKAIKDKLAAGYELFLMSALRVTDEKISPLLAAYRQGSRLVIPADMLYRLSLEALHPAMHQQFMRRAPQRVGADPHQFFFTRADGFSAHAFQWHPLAFSARTVAEDVGFDGQTIDARFPSDLLVGKDRARACYLDVDPPANGYMVGLDSAAGIARFGNFEVSPVGIVRSLEKWINRVEDFDHFEWMLRQRAVYRVPPDVRVELPNDCPDEDSTVEKIVAGIEAVRPEILRRIGRYARAGASAPEPGP
jgi:hypothetical protein